MANQRTRSGYTGDGLIGYLSVCRRCGVENKAYYVYADHRMRERMLNDPYDSNITGRYHNCQLCYPQFAVKRAAKWLGRVPRSEVDHDLAILGDGTIKIDFEGAERQANEDVKLEKAHDEMARDGEEKLQWALKKNKV